MHQTYSPCEAFTGAESNLSFWLLLGRELILPATGVEALAFEPPQPIFLQCLARMEIFPA